MTKDVIITVLKIVVAVITAILGFLGVTSLSSCNVGHSVAGNGRAVIITNDTTVINHSGYINFDRVK